MNSYKNLIRDIPDFPTQGILFKDITPLIRDANALKQVIRDIVDHFSRESIDFVVAIEARGYIFGAPVAYELGVGFIPIRKHGKLPFETRQIEYSLEYGSSTLEIHSDALISGQKVLIVDDILATGGTLKATIELVEQARAEVVGVAVLVELLGLGGSKHLANYKLVSLLHL